MPRGARAVIEGLPYHVTQRGNRRQQVFFSDDDRRRYLGWMRDYCDRYGLDILAYCLMDNHIHHVSIPKHADSLAKTLGIVHTRHSQAINYRFGWIGHLWQGRFYSAPLDDVHLYAAVKYVEMNPVRAAMVAQAEDYPWSSAAFHLGLRDDKLIRSDTIWGKPVEGWREELSLPEDDEMLQTLRARTSSGYPCGDESFIMKISEMLDRPLIRRPAGRPRKEK